ncbi:MAG TPA: FHA domain-containing protein [Gemmatimonadales bacterium]|nr:FHA domain-containing protein [Gemmatimonadales bacterium]
MSMLELGGRRFTIPMGEVVLGSDPQCAISLTGPGLLPRHALLVGQPDGQVVIRKAAPEADVMINGVRLGAEPTPLLHGDKLQVAGQELTFVDERRSGSTQFVPAMGVPGVDARPQTGPKSVGTTGGRLVSLTDGREYVIMASSLVMGREAGCDVVVPGKDVSRRHAEIVPSPKGYLLVDSSTNGVYVNDARVQGQRVLTRGDVIRIGEESFRFYSDQAAATPAPAPPPPPPPPPPGAESRLQNTSFGMPVTPRPAVAPANPAPASPAGVTGGAPLANFLVRGGALKGTRLLVKTPIVNIGRADYNDLIIPDESISTSHAKLQRREGVWVLVDLESTNGTFVDGERIKVDTPIAPGTMVRFGDIQLVFEPTDDALGVAKGGGTKVIESLKVPSAAAADASTPTAPPQPPPRPAAKPSPAPAPAPAPAAKPAAAPKGRPPKAAPAKRPGPPAGQAPQKKGKGCGSSAAVLVLATTALLYWILA